MRLGAWQSVLCHTELARTVRAMRITLRHASTRKRTKASPVTGESQPFRGQPTLCRDDEGHPLCTACGTCVETCPTGCIQLMPDQGQGTIQIDRSRCMYCGLCVTVCPVQALEMDSDTYQYVYVSSQHGELLR